MKSLQELIGQYPSRIDSLTTTLVSVTVIVFTIVFVSTIVKMYAANRKNNNRYSYYSDGQYSKCSIYTVASLVALVMAFNVGNILYFIDQNKVGDAYQEQVEAATVQDITKNFVIEKVETLDTVYQGDYYAVDTVLETPQETYPVSFMYDSKLDAMVPVPTSETRVEELQLSNDSALKDFMNQYKEFEEEYLEIITSFKDSDNKQFFVGSTGGLIASVIFAIIVTIAFIWAMAYKKTPNSVITSISIIGLIFTGFANFALWTTMYYNMEAINNAQIQNIEHNYGVVAAEYDSLDNDTMRATGVFKGSTETREVDFEYNKAIGHMIAVKNSQDVSLNPGSPLDEIISAE